MILGTHNSAAEAISLFKRIKKNPGDVKIPWFLFFFIKAFLRMTSNPLLIRYTIITHLQSNSL